MTSKTALFLGCVIPNRYPGIEVATYRLLERLGVEYEDMKGAMCCPPMGVTRSISEETWLTVSAYNLTLSDCGPILTLCNGCWASLMEGNNALASNTDLRDQANEYLQEVGRVYREPREVTHIVEFLMDIGEDRILDAFTNSLDLKVAVHYGCHLLYPSAIRNFTHPETPSFLDRLVELTGSESVDYHDKLMCCGGGGGVRRGQFDLSLSYSKRKLEEIEKAGAECILVTCPLCYDQFETSQKHMGDYSIPVLHLSQLYALAMGYSAEELGLNAPSIEKKT